MAATRVPGIYRPRHPERTAFYQVLSRHLDRYVVGTTEERFEPRYGPLRRVVPWTAEAYLECGRLAHRHVVFTVPRALRGLFERERRLLSLLSRCAYESVRRTWATGFGVRGAVPGMMASIQTFGSYANFHPHIHALVTNGVMTPAGEYLPLPEWTPGVIEEVFRRLVVRGLVRAERLSEEFREVLLGWERSGFSVYGEQVVVEGEEDRLLRRILEVDPLLCPRCGVKLQVISVITEPRVVDRILAHVREGSRDPFAARGPPG